MIFDILRHKYVVLSPEEWVRQHFIHYLLNEKHFPAGLMGNEIILHLNGTTKRCDTIVYNRLLQPLMLIEYKAPAVAIAQNAFAQICRYNAALQVPYLTLSNGLTHFCCKVDYSNAHCDFLQSIPTYDQLST